MAPPRTPKDVADLAALKRIALLAGHILITSRQPGRGAWDSERGLRAWLTDDGYSFANDDLAPRVGHARGLWAYWESRHQEERAEIRMVDHEHCGRA